MAMALGADRTSCVLALNSGSSSLKFGVYRVGPRRTERLLSGEAEFGDGTGRFHAEDSRGLVVASETSPVSNQTDAFVRIG